MQPGSRCCMSSRFRWRKKERKKKDLKGHDISYNGISEYSSEWFVIIKGHLLVCFFCTNVSGAFFCSLLFCWCRPHVIILNTSSYVCRSVHSLSLDTCIYILKVCLNDHFDRVWSAFFVSAIRLHGLWLVAIRPVEWRRQLSLVRPTYILFYITSKVKPLRQRRVCIWKWKRLSPGHSCWVAFCRGRHACCADERKSWGGGGKYSQNVNQSQGYPALVN